MSRRLVFLLGALILRGATESPDMDVPDYNGVWAQFDGGVSGRRAA
jgi:hypothetical protein